MNGGGILTFGDFGDLFDWHDVPYLCAPVGMA
jgi:hypothetical protein